MTDTLKPPPPGDDEPPLLPGGRYSPWQKARRAHAAAKEAAERGALERKRARISDAIRAAQEEPDPS